MKFRNVQKMVHIVMEFKLHFAHSIKHHFGVCLLLTRTKGNGGNPGLDSQQQLGTRRADKQSPLKLAG